MYYLIYGLLYGFSILPRFIVYGIGDGIAFLMNHVFGYRKEVVMGNLAIAFPEKTLAERKKIAAKFYHNLVDSFMEMIMMISISNEKLDKMYTGNMNLLNELAAKGFKIQLGCMHQFNWEVLNLIASRKLTVPFLGVYIPIKNQALEKIFYKMRTRFGTHMIAAPDFKKEFLKYDNKIYVLGLVADQSPGNPKNAFWLKFFGRNSAFVTGPEKGSVLSKSAVVFATIVKIKRGLYTAQMELVTENAALMPKGEITRRYRKFAEESIRNHPDNYLWSHRRWKHEYQPEYADNALEPLEAV